MVSEGGGRFYLYSENDPRWKDGEPVKGNYRAKI